MVPSLPQLEFNSNHEDIQPTREETFENFMQSSQQMLSDNVQHLSHLDMIASKLAGEQEKDLFSTQSLLDPKPTRPMSIHEHINLNKMNKKSKL